MKKYALLGHNIAYSKSPELHQLIGMAAGEECQYDLIDVKGDELEAALKRLNAEYDGYNVTKPYKEVLIKQELVDIVTPVAMELGAANTVLIKDGMTTAFNTDNFGFFQSWKMNRVRAEKGWKCLVLGAGGAARAVVSVVSFNFPVTVCNRDVEKAKKMLEEMKIKDSTAVSREEVQGDFDVIINATTLGLDGENSLPEGVDLSKAKVCMDLIYEPSETPFLEAAREAGVPQVVNGRWMLISQAIAAQQIWRGKDFDKDQLKEIFLAVETMI